MVVGATRALDGVKAGFWFAMSRVLRVLIAKLSSGVNFLAFDWWTKTLPPLRAQNASSETAEKAASNRKANFPKYRAMPPQPKPRI